MEEKLSPHQETAHAQPRDEHGHFIHPTTSQQPQNPQPSQEPSLTEKLFPTQISVDHSTKNDDLLDVHLGNPLRKITALLEEIKQQKAFSFTLKGSLGIMGVVLALSTFGFFSGSAMLCQKGIQSQVGTVRVLNYVEEATTIPVLSQLKDAYDYLLFHKTVSPPSARIILMLSGNATIELTGSREANKFKDQEVIATGDYDSCSRKLTLHNNSLELK